MTPRGLNGKEDIAGFIAFCDGFEEAGFVEYAQRGRAIARDLETALRELDDERRLRVAMQGNYERAIQVWSTPRTASPRKLERARAAREEQT